MVNGYCIGGAFTHCICSDFAVAANEAIFGLSEVNWGILPGGMVSKFVTETLMPRDAMFYACTGRTFDGKKAADMGLVNFSVPLKNLKRETLKLAKELLDKNQNVLRGTKHAIRATQTMDWNAAADYLNAKQAEIKMRDAARWPRFLSGRHPPVHRREEVPAKPVFSPYVGAGEGKSDVGPAKKAAKNPPEEGREESQHRGGEIASIPVYAERRGIFRAVFVSGRLMVSRDVFGGRY